VNGLIKLGLALNVALLGAVWTLPASPPARPLGLEWHPERVAVLGPAVDALPAFCVRIARLNPDDYVRVRAWLDGQDLATAATITLERPLGWWTYLPPVEATATVARDLAARGIKDAVLIKKGPLRHAFALGIHASEAQACAQRDSLLATGFLGVVCGPRPLPNRAVLTLPGADETALAGLNTAVPEVRGTAVACVSTH
jgi:hypothetical protein